MITYTRKSAASFVTGALAFAVAAFAAQVFAQTRDTLPAPGPARKVQVPVASATTLPNGLQVVVANRAVTPLVSVALYVRSGAEVDPPQLAGLAGLTANLLDKAPLHAARRRSRKLPMRWVDRLVLAPAGTIPRLRSR